VRLLAAAESWARQRGLKISASGGALLMAFSRFLEMAQAQLAPAIFEAALQEGQSLTLEQAYAVATENESDDSQLPKAGLGSSSD
jgi:hypothetical protein